MSDRPTFVTEEDIKRWEDNMEADGSFPVVLFDNPTIREVCYAGLWLCEQLDALRCPSEYITRIQYTAGQLSFGHDPWKVHQEFLESYKLNDMQFEPDPEPANIN